MKAFRAKYDQVLSFLLALSVSIGFGWVVCVPYSALSASGRIVIRTGSREEAGEAESHLVCGQPLHFISKRKTVHVTERRTYAMD